MIFVVNLKQTITNDSTNDNDEDDNRGSKFFKFFRQLINRHQLLILPFSLWVGLIQGFMIADFTRVLNITKFKKNLN